MNGTHHQRSPDDSKIINGNTRGMATETPENRAFLFKVLDLVDRYWNGSKSLHKHAKFKGYTAKSIKFKTCLIEPILHAF